MTKIVLRRCIMCPISNPQVGLKGVSQINAKRRMPSTSRIQVYFIVLLAAAGVLLPCIVTAQSLTGALIGTVKDEQGAVIPGAQVRATSPALIGGPATMITDETRQIRFPALAPGSYVLDIEVPGFAPYHEQDIRIGAGATLERTVVLKVAGAAESIVVDGSGSRIEARGSGFETRFGSDYIKTIPTRRYSMFDF